MFLACNTGQGIDWQLYEALGERLTLNDLLDIIEMRDVAASWSDAYRHNRENSRGG